MSFHELFEFLWFLGTIRQMLTKSTDDAVVRRKMYVELPIKVKTYDTDFMKIVNNTVYVKWFDDLRMALLDKYLPLEGMLRENNSPIIAETWVKYKKPLAMTNRPIGRVWMEELHKSRWIVRFEIVEGSVVFCEGRQEGYYYNIEKQRPVRFPEEFIELYEKM
jgi:acyl-CoA thioester hydrolase